MVSFLDTRPLIVFCDVGQGDGMYMRVESVDIVVDGGPGSSILNCLGKYMPFYDRTIELAVLTHPQADHMDGFVPILDRYTVSTFIINSLAIHNDTYDHIRSVIGQKHISTLQAREGTHIQLGQAAIQFYWPTDEFMEHMFAKVPLHTKNPHNEINSADLNHTSFIFTLHYGTEQVLFTGDATPYALEQLLTYPELKSTILKVPHHGSRNGLIAEFLELAEPALAVISSGKKNRYHHPSPEIIQMLQSHHTPYYRTDQSGNIVVRLTQTSYAVTTQK